MHRLTLLLCSLILATGLVPAFAQPAVEAQKKLQGTWTATKAERDGSAAADVVGHRLSVTGNRFQIQSQDGQRLHAGTVRLDPKCPYEHDGRPAQVTKSVVEDVSLPVALCCRAHARGVLVSTASPSVHCIRSM